MVAPTKLFLLKIKFLFFIFNDLIMPQRNISTMLKSTCSTIQRKKESVELCCPLKMIHGNDMPLDTP